MFIVLSLAVHFIRCHASCIAIGSRKVALIVIFKQRKHTVMLIGNRVESQLFSCSKINHHLLLQQNPEWFILLVPAYPCLLYTSDAADE